MSEYFIPENWSQSEEHRRKLGEAVNAVQGSVARITAANYADNGEMLVWARGDTFAASTGARMLADRILQDCTGTTFEVSKVLLPPSELQGVSSAVSAMQIAVQPAGESAYGGLRIRALPLQIFAASDVCFSLYLACQTKATICMELGYYNNGVLVAEIDRSIITVGPDWGRYYAAGAIPALDSISADAYLSANLWLDGFGAEGGLLFLLSMIKLELNDYPTPFIVPPTAETQRRCKAHYERGTGLWNGSVTAGTGYMTLCPYSEQKTFVPVVYCSDLANLNFPDAGFTIDQNPLPNSSFLTYKTATASGFGYYYFTWVAETGW